MRVLVVEDEPFVAMDIAAILSNAGWKVVGPAGSVRRALKLIEEQPCEAAILDANLNGESAAPIAETLQSRGIPFMVLSGYATEQLPGPLSGAPFLSKPCNPSDLVALAGGLCT
jgi:DNA-binding response OmpR family regulator